MTVMRKMQYKINVYRLLIVTIFSAVLLMAGVSTSIAQTIKNPLFDGFYAADPSVVQYNGKFYVYATIDPWGGDELAVFETKDFTTWEQKHINWPTRQQCTSPTSKDSKVWAPSVVQKNGRFYMYVSVGSEVWAGVADNPLGPWKNIKPDNSPLIPANYIPGYHMIDAECFIDDGQAYLYWGSGLNWVNGKCFVVKLKPDMYSFDGTYKDITPPNYFEGPFMFKHDSKYYLMYSNGKAIDSTYNTRYSVGDSPVGPWTEGANSPILQSTPDGKVVGPGHHTVFVYKGQPYILYHKIFPQKKDYVLRQLFLGALVFDKNGSIQEVKYADTISLNK